MFLSLFISLVLALTTPHVSPMDGVGGVTGGHGGAVATPAPLDGVGGVTGGH